MAGAPEGVVTALLLRWKDGDRSVENELVAAIYPALRDIARSQLRRSGGALTLQPTELVNEAYERLVRQQGVDWQNRSHFLSIAAEVVRRVVIDFHRERGAEKRGAGVAMVPIDDAAALAAVGDDGGFDWLAFDQALRELALEEPQCARVVELRVFADLSGEAIAEACGISTATVTRQWRFARSWLAARLQLPGNFADQA
jgi:RNA polymerase sigma factor (TIGR02999 family)